MITVKLSKKSQIILRSMYNIHPRVKIGDIVYYHDLSGIWKCRVNEFDYFHRKHPYHPHIYGRFWVMPIKRVLKYPFPKSSMDGHPGHAVELGWDVFRTFQECLQESRYYAIKRRNL